MRTTVSLLLVGLISLGTAGPVGPAADHYTVSVDLLSSIRPVKFGAVAAGSLFGGAGSRDDLFIIGQMANGLPQASIYSLASRGVDFVLVPPKVTSLFSEHVEISLRDVSFGDAVIADMDGNGENDIIFTGRTLFDILPTGNVHGEFTGIYYNFSSGASEEPTFVLDENTGIEHLYESRLDVADFNGDGAPDVVICGKRDRELQNETDVFGVVYLNDGAGQFETSFGFTGITPTTLAAGDYDGDGDQDFVVGGSLEDGSPVVRLYVNAGDGSFSEQVGALPDLYFPAADFGDVDGDGNDELLLTGGVLGPTIMRGVSTLYEYESGALTPRSDIDLPGLFYGQVEFGDMDDDGDLDFFIHGLTDPSESLGQRLHIYRNDGDGFTMRSDVRGTVFGGAAWVDYDGNGTREVVVAGEREDRRRIIIYELL